MRPAFLFEACRVRRLDADALLADPALAALDPDLDSVLNLNEPADYEAARARPAPEVTVRRFGVLRRIGTVGREPALVAAATLGEAAAGSGLTLDEHVVAALNGDQITRDPEAPLVAGDSVSFLCRGRRRLSRSLGSYPERIWSATVPAATSAAPSSSTSPTRAPRRCPCPTTSCAATSAARASAPGSCTGSRRAGVDPLGPDAPLAFCFSPLVGTPLTTSAKFAVVAKSPLTGLLNDALASSHFAIAGKLTGHDAIVVRGACDGAVGPGHRRRAARGSSPPATSGACRPPTPSSACASASARPGASPRSAPRASAWSSYATVSHDGRHAGRGGLGAVLGAKLLKAVAVRPATKVAPADPPAVLAAARDLRARSFGPATAKYRELGTLANLLAFNAIATLPTRNFQAATFADAPRLAAEDLAEARRRRPRQLRLVLDRLRAHLQGRRTASRRASSTRTSSRSARCAACPTPTPSSRRAAAATSSGSTPSRRAGRSPGRWSAPSAA